MAESINKKIVVLGKTGSGKSSAGNSIFGQHLKYFKENHSPSSETQVCEVKSSCIDGITYSITDTPGFFDTERSDKELQPEITRCIVECAPGPHAFLILLKVEKYTLHEQDIITQIESTFSQKVFKYAIVLFTHGDQLPVTTTIQDFVKTNKKLNDFVDKCGGRCHVIDNKYWNNNQQDPYRNNQHQVTELLKTIETMVRNNGGGCYTNEMLQAAETLIQEQEERLRTIGQMSEYEIRQQAKENAYKKLLIKLAGVGTGVLLGAFLGVAGLVVIVYALIKTVPAAIVDAAIAAAGGGAIAVGAAAAAVVDATIAAGGGGAIAAGGGGAMAVGAAAAEGAVAAAGGVTVGAGLGIAAGVVAAGAAAAGGVVGGFVGGSAAKDAKTPGEAAKNAAQAVYDSGVTVLEDLLDKVKGSGSVRYNTLENTHD